MKKNAIMRSEDRFLFNVKIKQETKTGFLNLSDLQEAYAHARVLHNWPDKRITHVLSTNENAERIYYLLVKQGFIKTDITAFIEEYAESPAKTLKKYHAYKTTGARDTRTTWCDPYIWALIAMELNPMLYATVVTWLTDKLILNRIEAGNFYIGLSKAMSSRWKTDFKRIGKGLNHIVFNRHESGVLRDTASQSQLGELSDLQKNLAFSIDMGYINSEEQLLKTMRNMYHKKWKKS